MPDPRLLHDRLDRLQNLPPEYADGLSSHLPMALHALWDLGADGATLDRFAARYAVRFEGRTAAEAPPIADWRAARGDIAAFAGVRAQLAARLAQAGGAQVLREMLPDLWPGVSAAALHGLIRTAHALEAGHAGELAAALAYWTVRWQPLPPTELQKAGDRPNNGPSVLTVEAWRTRLTAEALARRTSGRLIIDRMQEAAQSEAYRQLAGPQAPPAIDVPTLAAFAADLYARSGNFTVLHLLTGCRAAAVLLPLADAPVQAAPHLLRAFVAALLSCNLVLRDDAITPPPWASLVATAQESDDDHLIKLVHAAWRWHGVDPSGPWQAAAARACRLGG